MTPQAREIYEEVLGVSVIVPCYRDGARARSAANAMLAQQLPLDHGMEVIIVDDGSEEPVEIPDEENPGRKISVVALASNSGRSAARNKGASLAKFPYLVFMDCDCLPVDAGFLTAHLAALGAGAVAGTGRVTGTGVGFWSRYQSDASNRRERQHAQGIRCSGSSQNLSVRKAAFDAIAGFDERYRAYGFEDRDLLARLGSIGSIAWVPGACVRHLDPLTLRQVARKMFEVGAHTSRRFAADHPDAYLALGYSWLDTRRKRWLRPVARIGGVVAAKSAAVADECNFVEWAPYPIANLATKLIGAFAFAAGTASPR